MNVVGKVGSLITQGVYSVATPFHPFGGAVDVIVVQQQDGTFRTTPWYVRFGKFQGVLKGAEKIVRINVNGVEANFHMYLDNSGEAYFVKEVDDDKGIQPNGVVKDSKNSEFSRDDSDMDIYNKSNSYLSVDNVCGHRLNHSISDSGLLQLRDEDDSSGVPRMQRAESDVDHRYLEFQDEQSSFEDSVELSEYGSNQYECLDGEKIVEPPGSHPEVVLVSVDGHILTAPISESEQNTENLQLGTPQFHLGPGEGTDFCEGNEEFSSGENAWASNCTSQLDASTADVPSSSCCNTSGDDNVSGLQLEVSQGKEGHICQAGETLRIKNQEEDHLIHIDSVEVSSSIKRRNVFKKSLGLQEFTQQVGNADLPDLGSPLEVRNLAEESNANCPVVYENEQGTIVLSKNINKLSSSSGFAPSDGNRSPSVELGLREVGKKKLIEEVDDSKQTPALEEDSNKSDIMEPQTETSNERDQSHPAFEISLCGHDLKAGIGVIAAKELFEAHRISAETFRISAPSIIKNENLIIKFRERYLAWEKAAPFVLGMAAFDLDIPIEPKDAIPVEQDDALKSRNNDPGCASPGRRWRLWPIPFRKVKTLECSNSSSSIEEVFVDSESGFLNSPIEPTSTFSSYGSPHKHLKRTNVPTNNQIASLNLNEGQNLVTFSFSTRVLGTQQVDAHIYLWKWNVKIVISDVDGTITKHPDELYKENGYQLLFLSARAIVQAYLTRRFLLNLKQDGKTLPNGPVVISPDGLFPSLYREVIRRAPHEFKIACLEDIKRLFPSDHNPFYAGFGNRDTDELSYRKIGIPKGKIFIINPKGEVAISHCIDVKSYTSLHTLVNDMFPPTNLVEQEDFNLWNYWKMACPEIDD